MTESSKQGPPREFWISRRAKEILFSEVRVGTSTYAFNYEPNLGEICGKPGDIVHVIEASYAKELEAKLAVAVEALEFYANQNNWGMIHNEPTEDGGEEDIGARIDYDDVCRDEHDNNFMCAGEKARAVLAMIDSEGK